MYLIRYRSASEGKWVTLAKALVKTEDEAFQFAIMRIRERYCMWELTLPRYAAHIWLVCSCGTPMGFVKITHH